jgi:hypothetical protein
MAPGVSCPASRIPEARIITEKRVPARLPLSYRDPSRRRAHVTTRPKNSASPWRPTIGTLPADDQLDRAVEAHKAAKRTEVSQRKEALLHLVADPEVYEHRLAERGSREYDRWYKVRGKWVRMTNINKAHTASAAVNEGSVKAIRTTLPADHPDALSSLPDRPSVAWLQMVDKRAAIDQGRTETAESEKRRGVWEESVENVDNFDATRPSRPTPPKPTEGSKDDRGE